MKSLFFMLCFAILLSESGFSQQQRREKLPAYFGIQFKPIIPGDFLSESVITVNDGNFSGTFSQQPGYSFGGIIRISLSRLISLETGINQVKRSYEIQFQHPDSSLQATSDFGILSYEL